MSRRNYSKIGIRLSENGSDSRLTEAGALNLHIRLRPYFLETGVGRGGLFLFTLTVEALHEAKERPAVLRQAREVVSIHLFGFGKAAFLHECSAKRMTRGQNPVGRLAVSQRVLDLNRFAQFGETLVTPAFAKKNFAGLAWE